VETSLFDYALPEELIAKEPAAARDGGRMLVLQDGIEHARVAELPARIAPGSLLVLNDTKVMRARVIGHKPSGGRAEIFLLRPLSPGVADGEWEAMGRASKPLRPGAEILAPPLHITINALREGGLLGVTLRSTNGKTISEAINEAGQLPLPPYLERAPTAADEERYQTVFADKEGAVAAPTAGLHLTQGTLLALETRGVSVAKVTLHVGLGTFRPVTAADFNDHLMHSEWFEIPAGTKEAVDAARARGAKVVAVGTTVVRALESARDRDRPGHVRQMQGDTNIFIQPGYDFGVVDMLLTNFHLPKSTLLALVSAFGGHARIMSAYAEAIRERYRFYSYGDAMLLSPEAR
jgi:S-adenosylmethionine:tRNA ribosyltransferase-isomerase